MPPKAQQPGRAAPGKEPKTVELDAQMETQPETQPEKAQASVRVYEVTASMIMHQFTPNQQGKQKGERLASVELVPPQGMTAEELEQRYLETGGIVLLETVSRDEWDKRQK